MQEGWLRRGRPSVHVVSCERVGLTFWCSRRLFDGERNGIRVAIGRRGILIASGIFAVVCAVLVLAGVAGSSPSACAKCHDDAVLGLGETAHADTACYACHAPSVALTLSFKASELFDMYPATLVGVRPGAGPGSRVSADACRGCHESVFSAVEPTTARGLRILHSACAADVISCDACHAVDAHGSATRYRQSASMGACVDCHDNAGASVVCASCHTDGYERDDLLSGPFRVTHGANWQQTHGMGDLRQCILCHQEEDCGRCHGTGVPHSSGFGAIHGKASLTDGSKCSSCHMQTFCDDCHDIEMPHPDGFLPEHSSLVTSVNDTACLRCHSAEDCERCHVQHVHPGGARESFGLDVPGGSSR